MPSRLLDDRRLDPLPWVELFALSNIAFLAVDIYVAHSVNAFERPAEWVPILFSTVGTVLFAGAMAAGGLRPTLPGREGPGALGMRQRFARWVGLAVGGGSVLVGVAGLLLHLDSQFFKEETFKNLVYTAPFAAPLAYAGVGLLILLDRMVDAESVEWARWVGLLALGGFVGNFVLTLADHAQNGFFQPAEWVAVIASAFAVGFLAAAMAYYDQPGFLKLCAGVLGIQVLVGLLGFALHGLGNLRSPMGSLWERMLYGSPIFAPLLFADLALLGGLGLWAMARRLPRGPSPAPAEGAASD